MSEEKITNANFIHLSVPLQYVKVYASILAALSDYGEDMLEDCKASCTDKDSGIIECFNMFNAAIAAFRLGEIKEADTIISYIESTIQLKYKNIVIPDSISFPVEEENVTINFDFNNPPYFEMIEGLPIPLESIEIEGASTIEDISSVYTCILNPEDTTETLVEWSIISGNEYAYIDSTNGTLYLKSIANSSRVVIKVTSLNNSEIYATKEVTCTYNKVSPTGELNVVYDSDVVENGSTKEIQVNVSDKEPIRLELYKNNNGYSELIKAVEYVSSYNFSVEIYGENTYKVKAIFRDGTELVSENIVLIALPCCYLGAATNWLEIYNDYKKLSPMLDIGSAIGKQYSFNVINDGDFLFILVPRIDGHMAVDEIRMDETNIIVPEVSEYSFDMPYIKQENITTIKGVAYDLYIVTLDNKGFKQGDYRIIITS